MSNSDQAPSRRQHIHHIIDEAAGITFLLILDIMLLALAIYFSLQGSEFSRLFGVLLLAFFLVVAIVIYRVAVTEEKEEEQYASERSD
jgi:Ca2+/Na+ antiporter